MKVKVKDIDKVAFVLDCYLLQPVCVLLVRFSVYTADC